jgi:hypothetical protein
MDLAQFKLPNMAFLKSHFAPKTLEYFQEKEIHCLVVFKKHDTGWTSKVNPVKGRKQKNPILNPNLLISVRMISVLFLDNRFLWEWVHLSEARVNGSSRAFLCSMCINRENLMTLRKHILRGHATNSHQWNNGKLSIYPWMFVIKLRITVSQPWEIFSIGIFFVSVWYFLVQRLHDELYAIAGSGTREVRKDSQMSILFNCFSKIQCQVGRNEFLKWKRNYNDGNSVSFVTEVVNSGWFLINFPFET